LSLKSFRVLLKTLVPNSPFHVGTFYLLVLSFTWGSPFEVLYWVPPFPVSTSCVSGT